MRQIYKGDWAHLYLYNKELICRFQTKYTLYYYKSYLHNYLQTAYYTIHHANNIVNTALSSTANAISWTLLFNYRYFNCIYTTLYEHSTQRTFSDRQKHYSCALCTSCSKLSFVVAYMYLRAFVKDLWVSLLFLLFDILALTMPALYYVI